ncbi:hypothetical protein LCGC14_2571930 [marine sediment metagenome]|uniref:Uncharacterized protein n=1 Tax=marine sediment metagenome TaxID=412755 RepID=A0A0F9AHG3_9ZZZZ
MQKIRAYQANDLTWVEPIAKKYGEWEHARTILASNRLTGAWVIERKAITAVYKDEHGHVGVGLCNKDGIKELFKLARKMTTAMTDAGEDVHTHVDKDTWQYRMFLKLGYVESWPDGMLKAYAVHKEVA